MAGKAGAKRYDTPGVKVDMEFPEQEAGKRNSFWRMELDKIKAEPGAVFKYEGASASNGASLRKHDWHIEYVVNEGNLYVRWNPDAKQPEPKPRKAKSASKATANAGN